VGEPALADAGRELPVELAGAAQQQGRHRLLHGLPRKPGREEPAREELVHLRRLGEGRRGEHPRLPAALECRAVDASRRRKIARRDRIRRNVDRDRQRDALAPDSGKRRRSEAEDRDVGGKRRRRPGLRDRLGAQADAPSLGRPGPETAHPADDANGPVGIDARPRRRSLSGGNGHLESAGREPGGESEEAGEERRSAAADCDSGQSETGRGNRQKPSRHAPASGEDAGGEHRGAGEHRRGRAAGDGADHRRARSVRRPSPRAPDAARAGGAPGRRRLPSRPPERDDRLDAVRQGEEILQPGAFDRQSAGQQRFQVAREGRRLA